MWLGVRENAEMGVRAGFKFIQFSVIPEADACAVDEYLKSLTPTPSPFLIRGRPSPAAKRGRDLFAKAGCAECHPAPLFTDMKRHDVGSSEEPVDAGEEFDTPSLAEAWRTAPYLHDGRAATLEDLFTKFNPDNKHGTTKYLTREQLNELCEYVSSL
jgi:cytochrome c peroxidase